MNYNIQSVIKLLLFNIFVHLFFLKSISTFMNNQMGTPNVVRISKQQLVLISGCTGTGKSTFGMEVAINRGILKCISTDTIRQVHRAYDNHPAVQRSSYSGSGDPIVQWKETCDVLQHSIDNIVIDALSRGTSLVLEGVHIIPSNYLLDQWVKAGGVAVGCVLCIPDAETHRQVIFKRGELTTKGAEDQLKKFDRIRAIQDEMVRLGVQNKWLLIKQKPCIDPKPMELLNDEMVSTWVQKEFRY